MIVTHIVSKEEQYFNNEPVEYREDGETSLELTSIKKQKILGFGGCFNELGFEALQLANEKDKTEFLDDLFNGEHCGFNYGRIPIGAYGVYLSPDVVLL